MDKHNAEYELKRTFETKLEISELVEDRISETYKQILLTKISNKKVQKTKKWKTIAAAAICFCFASTSIVLASYFSQHSDFYNGFFDNIATGADKTLEDTTDNNNNPMSEELADELIGKYISDEEITKTIGDYTISVESHIVDTASRSGRIYYSLESNNGFAALNQVTDSEVAFNGKDLMILINTSRGTTVGERTSLDASRSTDVKKYLCVTYSLSNQWNENEDILLRVIEYKDEAELEKDSDADVSEEITIERDKIAEKNDSGYLQETVPGSDNINYKIKQQADIVIPKLNTVPSTTLTAPGSGNIAVSFSPIAIAINMNEMNLDEFAVVEDSKTFIDPYHIRFAAFEYADGSKYIIQDEANNFQDAAYALSGEDNVLCYGFNKLVERKNVVKVLVNELEFVIE